MTKSEEAELKQTFDGDDLEFGAGKNYGLCESKDNPFVTFSSDCKQVIKFPTCEDARLHTIECKTNFSGNEQLKAAALARNHGRFTELDASHPEDRKKMKELIPKCHRH